MPACCVKNCKNRRENGFRMFIFPRDKQRKQVWVEKCGQNVTSISRLCEYHFDDSQFENHRQDKWRKLKPNAVPTIFINNQSNSTITSNNQLAVEQQTSHENLFENDHIQDLNPVISANFNINIKNNENVIDGNSLNECFPSAKMITDASIQTDDSDIFTIQTKYISNEQGTIRQANEIKYLQLQLEKEQVEANILKSKYKNEKLLRLKMTKKVQFYKKKCSTLSKKFEKIPFLKEFAAGLSNPKPKWSPQCSKLATQIRYAVGWKAYLYLRKDLRLPIPSYSTLCRHINKLDFSPDLLKDVLPLMAKKKITHSSIHQSDCVVLMDEMDIEPSLEYDISTGSFIGQTTCEEKTKTSTSLVVFMLRGLTENWKQIISWHLTSKFSNDSIMTQLLLEIIEQVEKIGFRVHGLVCDMGPKNQAIWRNLGVNVTRNNVLPFIDHPVRTGYSFYTFPDIPHLLKNLRMALTNNSIIIIALSIVEFENLPCNEVRFKYLEELVAIQQRCSDLKLAPNLTADILRPSSFNKMKVAAAAHIFSVKTAVALETLIKLKMIEKLKLQLGL